MRFREPATRAAPYVLLALAMLGYVVIALGQGWL